VNVLTTDGLAHLIQKIKTLITNIDNNKTDKTDTPFSFGIDAQGNYGYKKQGTDTIIPFKRVSKKAGEIVCGYHQKSLDCSSFEDRDLLTVDNFYLMPTSFTVQNIKDDTATEGTITLGTYNLHKTYKDYILTVQRDSIAGDIGVELNCDVYIIY